MKQIPKTLPQPARELLRLISVMDDDAVKSIGLETERQMVDHDTVGAMWRWVKQDPDRKVWYDALSAWCGEFVESRFGIEAVKAPAKFIRPGIEAACIGSVMYAADAVSIEVYRDACRGFHAAYAAEGG